MRRLGAGVVEGDCDAWGFGGLYDVLVVERFWRRTCFAAGCPVR